MIGSLEELIIYESHPGMAQEREGIGTFVEFADYLIPYIKNAGYNTIQLMAVAEHPYYGSFGYHVSNFFAVSSRFGTPDDLQYLIKKAHEQGIAVIMDIVHSHTVKNTLEGLNLFDGSDDQYFHPGERGNHPHWGSKMLQLRKEGGSAVPPVEHQILDEGVPFRRVQVRRGNLDDVFRPWLPRRMGPGGVFHERGRMGCDHLPAAGQ